MYGEDLAFVHDDGFLAFAERAGPAILDLFRRYGVRAGESGVEPTTKKKTTVVDLGCGSGVWARRLEDLRYRVVGYDASRAMVELAKKRTTHAELHVRSFLDDFPLPRCEAVTAMGECLNYRPASERGPAWLTRKRLFSRVYEALGPGGLFVFDVAAPGRSRNARPSRFESPSGDWVVLVDYHEEGAHGVLIREITTFRRARSGDLYRRTDEVHRLQLFEIPRVLRELRNVGFRARSMRGYGAEPLPESWSVVLARKPR